LKIPVALTNYELLYYIVATAGPQKFIDIV